MPLAIFKESNGRFCQYCNDDAAFVIVDYVKNNMTEENMRRCLCKEHLLMEVTNLCQLT